jgi:predicted acylesterase/phospholipase RssA
MSVAIPILMTPIYIDDKCFVDGTIGCNYPLSFCIESGKTPDEILGVKNTYSEEKTIINSESNMLQFLLNFIHKAFFYLSKVNIPPQIENEVVCQLANVSFDSLKEAVQKMEVRKELFEEGVSFAMNFLNKSFQAEELKEDSIDLENSVQELN